MNRGNVAAGIGTLVLMILCCGGPLLIVAGATIGPALLSVIGVPIIVVFAAGAAVVIGIVLCKRRACSDCELDTRAPCQSVPIARRTR